MLLASTPARARVAHFHGLQLVAASRIAVLLGESIKGALMVEIGFLPSEVMDAAQIRAACRSSREAARLYCEHRDINVTTFPIVLRNGNPAGTRGTLRRPASA